MGETQTPHPIGSEEGGEEGMARAGVLGLVVGSGTSSRQAQREW